MKMKKWVVCLALVLALAGTPLLAMTVPSAGTEEPAGETLPAHAGGYLSEGEAILLGMLLCLLVLLLV